MSTAEQYELNKNLAQMLKGGVIMDVTTPEQAKIAEEAGACAVMALERIPADIRAAGGVSRMSDPQMIRGIPICDADTDTDCFHLYCPGTFFDQTIAASD